MFLNYKELVFILKLKKFPDQQKKIRSIARPEKKWQPLTFGTFSTFSLKN